MNNTIDISTAAKLLGVSDRHVRRMCVKGKLPGASDSTGAWQIPITANAAFRPAAVADKSSVADLTDIPQTKRDEALRRLGIVTEARKFVSTAVSVKKADAIKAFAAQKDVAWQTLYRWMKRQKDLGVAGLIDKRGGNDGQDLMTPAAWDHFYSLWMTPRQPTVKACYINTQFYSQQHNLNWRLPKLRTVQNYIDERIPVPMQVLHREGLDAYNARCAPYIMVDQMSVEPGSVWVGDHHKFDCWIRHRGRWIRPWITAWEDYRSRKIVGWFISDAPNSTTILQAMKRGIENYGPPASVKIDNGKDYDSQGFTGQTKKQRKAGVLDQSDCELVAGIYGLMKIGVSFALPYHGQSKKIERWFATLSSQFTKTIATYCGRNTLERPDGLPDYLKTEKAVAEAYTLETFTAAIDKYISIYNASAHTGDGMNGQSPDAVFNQRTSRRMVDPDALELLMQVWAPGTVGKNGVKFKNYLYGQFNHELHRHFGQKVWVSYNPDDITQVNVYDLNYKRITIAVQHKLQQYGRFGEEELRKAMAEKNRNLRIVKQAGPARRLAAMNLTDTMLLARQNMENPEVHEQPGTNITPVPTPLDTQIKAHIRQRNQLAVRKAVGAENLSHVADLDIDLIDTNKSTNDLSGFDMDLLDNNVNRKNLRLSDGEEFV